MDETQSESQAVYRTHRTISIHAFLMAALDLLAEVICTGAAYDPCDVDAVGLKHAREFVNAALAGVNAVGRDAVNLIEFSINIHYRNNRPAFWGKGREAHRDMARKVYEYAISGILPPEMSK